ncbi:hypothetical protein SteCoe_33798 [Stentor coeruleus]|uniref:Uncharacterized protein n=1 Tax=Stentor coeruleus TaxID=5963 RepID=A0A1R2AVY4_9CILI|nr:hypothetical protein SteCoe_33798 [Stentor coeruleus]
MGCSVFKQKSLSLSVERQKLTETSFSDALYLKRLQFYDILKEKDEINKKKILNAPILNITKSDLYTSRLTRHKANT